MNVTLESVARSFRQECDDEDHVGLWEISEHFRESWAIGHAGERKRLSLRVVRLLLQDDSVGAGEYGDDGSFTFWRTSIDQTCDRIEKAWNDLGRDPEPGEICWIVSRGKPFCRGEDEET